MIALTHIWRWRTVTDPNAPAGAPRIPHPLAHRAGEACRVFARGRNGNVGIEFGDGERVVAPRHAIRRQTPKPGELMAPTINTRTVISAVWQLGYRHGASVGDHRSRWPTETEIAEYLNVDVAIVRPLLRELRDNRLFRDRRRQGRRVWMPWEAV